MLAAPMRCSSRNYRPRRRISLTHKGELTRCWKISRTRMRSKSALWLLTFSECSLMMTPSVRRDRYCVSLRSIFQGLQASALMRAFHVVQYCAMASLTCCAAASVSAGVGAGSSTNRSAIGVLGSILLPHPVIETKVRARMMAAARELQMFSEFMSDLSERSEIRFVY